jgi:hypothetical protein
MKEFNIFQTLYNCGHTINNYQDNFLIYISYELLVKIRNDFNLDEIISLENELK